jgi:hypothetical protein
MDDFLYEQGSSKRNATTGIDEALAEFPLERA